MTYKKYIFFIALCALTVSCSKLTDIVGLVSVTTEGIVKKDSIIEEALFQLYNHLTGEELERAGEEAMTRQTAIACFQREIENDTNVYGYSRTFAVERFLYEAGYDKKIDGEIIVSPEKEKEDKISKIKTNLNKHKEEKAKELLKNGS